MKRSLQLLTLTSALLVSGAAVAQNAQRISPAPSAPGVFTAQFPAPETTACGPDVSDYIFQKEDTVPVTNANNFYFLSIWPGEKMSTGYIMDQPATVTGVMFVGRVKPGSSAPTTVELGLWSVSNGFVPQTLLATTTVSVTATNNFYQALFTTPVAISDSFAVTMSNIDALDTVQAIINDYQDPTTQEGLSYYDYQGIWETVNAAYGINAEFRILPIVTYSVTADFTFPNVTNCIGNSIQFTNASSSIYGNRMFNQHAFDTYFLSEADSTFRWDFGDGSPIVYGSSPSHSYAAAGTYTVSMTGRMQGVLADCSDTKTATVTVQPNVASAFTYDASQEPMVSFTDASTGTDANTTYAWDFGDGNNSTAMSPTHTYGAPGTYTVTLVTAGPCGSSTTTQTVTITATGIELVAALEVKAFFNASEQVLNVSVSSNDAVITVYDMLGQVIRSEKANASTGKINMAGVAEGTYIVHVKTSNGIGAARFVVTR